MRAIHLSFGERTFYLWGEEPREKPQSADPTLLKHLVQGELFQPSGRMTTVKRTLWLPARGGVPVPSSPLLGDEPDRRKKTALAPFSLSVLPLKAQDLQDLFQRDSLEAPPGTGLILGQSLHWGLRLFRLVENLIAQESYLPSLVQRDSTWEAVWIPVLSEEGERAMEHLAESLPGVLRSMASGEKPPEIPAMDHTREMVSTVLDSLIRLRLSKGPQKALPSLHDVWLEALRSPSPEVRWKEEKDIVEFAAALDRWSRPARLHSESAFRFCLRLEEPPSEEDRWEVRYLLQPKADPSTLLPLEEVFKGSGSIPKKLLQTVSQEFILTALGQGARLSPHMAQSLEKKELQGFSLSSSEALHFLKEEASALQASGFTLQLPSWWINHKGLKKVGLTAKASSSSPSDGDLGLESLLDFQYVLSLGGEEITPEEMRMLAELKTPLVRFRGQWIETSQEHIKKALDFLKKQGSRKVAASEVLASALTDGGLQVDDLPLERVAVEGWFAQVLDDLKSKNLSPETPPQEFNGTLRHYQEEGFAWLSYLRRWGLGACLADDMGLGKTVQTLAHIQREREKGETQPALLICPTSVVNNWLKEAERFTPELPVLVHHGTARNRKKSFQTAAQDHGLVISTFGLLQRDLALFQEVPWSSMILDEAQNIKNPDAKQSKAARSVEAKHRIALTGTPVENRPMDLWSLIDFLNPGLLGSQSFFKKTFKMSRETSQGESALEKLRKVTAPFLLRRLKTDKTIIKDLPEKIVTKEYCSLTKEQASLYQSVLDDLQDGLKNGDAGGRNGLVLATLTKLKQICNHPAHFLGDNSPLENRSGKLRRLVDLLEEFQENQEHCLIFTQYREMGEMLQGWLRRYFAQEVFLLHGGIPRKKRDEMVEAFQSSPNAPKIFVLSLKAGGTGITLTRANHVVHFDRWWNPAVENQATDRAFRIGQDKNVQVHTFIVPGTLEERIDTMLENKKDLAEKIVGGDNVWIGNLSDRELQDLLRLDREALEV